MKRLLTNKLLLELYNDIAKRYPETEQNIKGIKFLWVEDIKKLCNFTESGLTIFDKFVYIKTIEEEYPRIFFKMGYDNVTPRWYFLYYVIGTFRIVEHHKDVIDYLEEIGYIEP